MRSFAGRDILSLKDFERQEFFRVFDTAALLEPIARDRHTTDMLKNKVLVTAFYQPSTRTRLAHEAAMLRLGGHVTGFSDAKMTRAGDWYQESIKDTVKMLEFYGDVIVMRHYQKGAPQEAAKWSSIPIINGGDGWGEHPTQILTDLYTVLVTRKRIDGLKWVAVGDMRMRTMHSLGYALTQFDCPITFVGPGPNALFPGSPDMRMPEEYKNDFNQYSLNYREAESV
jgi:aspartate carbamoyltransferase catalytic subunit